MPVYKDEQRNSWYCKCNYKDWLGESKAKMKRGFSTKKEALQWEREFLEKQSASMDMKFSSFVEVYFRDKTLRLKERSVMTKRVLIETKILPYFEERKMNEITAVDIIKWQNALLNQEYKPTYLRMIQNQMTAIFNHAERYYELKNNPCKKVDKMGRANAKELNFWTKDEYEVFMQGFTTDEEMYRIIFLMLFWLGCRVGELLALTSEDIDLESGTVSISKTYYRRNQTDYLHRLCGNYDVLHHHDHQCHYLCINCLCGNFSGGILHYDRCYHPDFRAGAYQGDRYPSFYRRIQAECIRYV
jgi:integrase